MNSTIELHQQAMDLAETAVFARKHGESDQAEEFFRQAFKHELEAAQLLSGENVPEPTRSVVHRSAAALALECGEWQAAEKLIATALSGSPPLPIARELRTLWDRTHFYQYIDNLGMILNQNEIHVSMIGTSIVEGMIHTDEFLGRIRDVAKLIYRTAARKMSRSFENTLKKNDFILKTYPVYTAVPNPGSFSITLRVGSPAPQLILPGVEDLVDSNEIITEVMDCLDLFRRNESQALKTRIQDPDYYTNFVQLVRKLSPDGEKVSVVGFTAEYAGKKRALELSQPRSEVSKRLSPILSTPESLEVNPIMHITGELRFADSDATTTQGKIKIIDQDGVAYPIDVPKGMMADIVKPLYEETVTITGVRQGAKIILEDIESAE